MTDEGEKVIDPQTGQVGRLHEDTMLGLGARHHPEIDLTYVQTHGYHPVGAMDVQEVVPPSNTAVVHALLPAKVELMRLLRTEGDDLHRDDFHHGEMIEFDPPPHGDPNPLTARVDHEIHPAVAVVQDAIGMCRRGVKTCD